MTPTRGDNWEKHWQTYADSAQINPAQRYRRQLIFSLLSPGPGPVRIVDIGSGQGDLAQEAAVKYPSAQILGLELSEAGVRIAANKVPSATFVVCDLLDPLESPGPYEEWATAATCSEVLEHVDEPARLLRNAARYLAPNARILVTVPGGPRSAFDRHIGHRKHFSTNSLREVFLEAGLEPIALYGAGFPFFNLYRLLMVALGDSLVASVAGEARSIGRSARLAMRVFDLLFRLNVDRGGFGWQIIGIARKPQEHR